MTPAGIETTTFRFLAQNLNHCATAVPRYSGNISNLTEAIRKDLKEVSTALRCGLSQQCYLVEVKFLPANKRNLLPPPLGFVVSNRTG